MPARIQTGVPVTQEKGNHRGLPLRHVQAFVKSVKSAQSADRSFENRMGQGPSYPTEDFPLDV